jgi:plastocyanin
MPVIAALIAMLLPLAPIADGPAEAPPPPGLGIVSGLVSYDGPPLPPVLNAEAGTRRQPIDVDRSSNGLREVAVWLEGIPEEPSAVETEDDGPILVDQVQFEFVPRVVTVRAGRPVAFLNSDVANHGVTSSDRSDRNRFNVTRQPGSEYVHRFVPSRQPVAIGCPVHSAMSAWIFVLDHDHHTVTDDHGRFELPPAPPGRFDLVVHHPDGGLRRRIPVEIRAGERTTIVVDFLAEDLDPPARP